MLAEALARGDARHIAVKRNRAAIDAIRETWRRSGGKTPRLGIGELASMYEARLAGVNSMDDFRHANLDLTAELEARVPSEVRARYEHLPRSVFVRDHDVDIQYDVEEGPNGSTAVARLRLPEKLARTLVAEELPALDRSLRFVVPRGARGAARGATLTELQNELERPFTEAEIAELDRARREGGGGRRGERRRQREAEDGGRGGREGGGRRKGKRARRRRSW